MNEITLDKARYLMVCGDWHGDTEHALRMVRACHRLGMRKIVQLGDFGLWDHTFDGVRYLDTLNAACRPTGVKIYVLLGNHENYDSYEGHAARGPFDQHGHLHLRSHIRISPHGNRWHWAGRNFMTVGGAVSIDRDMRVPGESWWPQEQLTDADVERIEQDVAGTQAGYKVDYLFTHDCPTSAPFRIRLKDDPDSHIHRQRMDRVGRAVAPTVWMHGHMHERYEYTFPPESGSARVYGVSCNREPHSYGVLDTKTAEWVWSPDRHQELPAAARGEWKRQHDAQRAERMWSLMSDHDI